MTRFAFSTVTTVTRFAFSTVSLLDGALELCVHGLTIYVALGVVRRPSDVTLERWTLFS